MKSSFRVPHSSLIIHHSSFTLLLLLLLTLPAQADDVLDLVDTRIGAGGKGFGVGAVPPGPQVPFGAMRLGPDTGMKAMRLPGRNFGGYHVDDSHVWAFSHTHTAGAGTMDYGNVAVMPVAADNPAMFTAKGIRAPIDRSNEFARPGYYAVSLKEPQVRCELTASQWTGVHRYTFLGADEGVIIINPTITLDNGACQDASIAWNEQKGVFEGFVHNKGGYSGRFGGFRLYFVAEFRGAPKSWGVFAQGRALAANNARGTDVGAFARFDTSQGQTVELAVTISFISIEQAHRNREADPRGLAFHAVRDRGEALWRSTLSLSLEGGGDEQRRIFATALYHVFCSPTDFTEAGELYQGFDGKSHRAERWRYYTDLSLWDTFRTQHPLLVLLAPTAQRDVVRSLLAMAEQGGDLPRWPMATGYTSGMIGTHADVVIADSYLKGITDFDVEAAYRYMRLHAMEKRPNAGRAGLDEYKELGYCPNDVVGAGASHTLEYAYDDFAIARMADALGKTEDARLFDARAKNYRHVWDPETKFFRGRNKDGSWVTPFNPTNVFDKQFVEGDAWHWRWFVPHDVPGLIDLFGSKRAFIDELSTFFAEAAKRADTALPDPYYWHGNEPDIHAAYLFALAGRPDLTQRAVRWVMHDKYRAAPDGIDGNDDYGTLSAWYVFSALGFYPIAGTKTYVIGSPIFTRAVIQRPQGDWIIEAENASPTALYVQSLTINGKPWNQPTFSHEDMAKGGIVRFVMGQKPSRWACGDAPGD